MGALASHVTDGPIIDRVSRSLDKQGSGVLSMFDSHSLPVVQLTSKGLLLCGLPQRWFPSVDHCRRRRRGTLRAHNQDGSADSCCFNSHNQLTTLPRDRAPSRSRVELLDGSE